MLYLMINQIQNQKILHQKILTPYENGLFLFDICLHKDYPNTPLHIKHVTKG